MNYSEKLLHFNSTEKYRKEYKFLKGLLGIKQKTILDYGCGLGTNVEKLNAYTEHIVFGYDAEKWSNSFPYIDVLGKYDVIYFMHSIAHMQYIEHKLSKLREHLNPGGKVIVITPNKSWIEKVKNENYKPDPTVFKHYNQAELRKMFEDSGYTVDMIGQFGEEIDGVNERIFMIAK